MKSNIRTISLFLSFMLVAALISAGCQKPEQDKKQPTKKTSAAKPASAEKAKPKKPVEPPPKPTIPKTKFTEQQAKANIIKVGEMMPDAELQDLSGKPVKLRSLFGKKLTVICFWNSDGTSGLQAIDELEKYISQPYAEKGVAVIGINQGDPVQTIKEKIDLAGAKFVMLQDPAGAYFKKIATAKLPRVYLLDADGKILWFDIEYSQSMRRDLTQGIDVALTK